MKDAAATVTARDHDLVPLALDSLERYVRFDAVNAPYIAWQVQQFLPYVGERVLEIGCGAGSVIAQLPKCELICGVDADALAVQHCAGRFADRPECRFAALDFSEPEPDRIGELSAQQFDTVLCINVLEHIRDDVAALAAMERIVQPRAMVGLLVPAHPRLYGAYDRIDGHCRRYTRGSLKCVIAQTGFRIVRLRYFNALGAVGWWIRYRLLSRTMHGEREFRVMNRFVPVLRVLERIVPPPFGLSVVAVLQKP